MHGKTPGGTGRAPWIVTAVVKRCSDAFVAVSQMPPEELAARCRLGGKEGRYHRSVTDFFTLAYAMGSRTGAPFSASYRRRPLGMHRALAECTDETGRIPSIADCDQGRAYEMTSVDGEARSIFEEAGAGVFVPPEDPEAMACAIHQLMASPAEKEALGAAGCRYVETRMYRDRLARQYQTILAGVSGN